jgi:hypothetical protein
MSTDSPRVYSQRIIDYIRRIAYNIVDVSDRLNANPNAIAGAIAGEYFEYFRKGRFESAAEGFVSFNANNIWSHEWIKDNYETWWLREGRQTTTPGQKAFNPTANDLGPGSINLGTAINLLLRHRDSPDSSGDPLHVGQYYDDYAKLARDLDNPLSGATERFTGLAIERAQDFFINERSSNFLSRTPAEQEGLLIWFYNVGEEYATRRYASARTSWLLENHPAENFVWNPQLPVAPGPGALSSTCRIEAL